MNPEYTILQMIPETRILYAKYNYSSYPYGTLERSQKNICYLPVVGYALVQYGQEGKSEIIALVQGKYSVKLVGEWEGMSFECFVQEPK